MAIHRRENQYQGVNAHLHSYYQAHGNWSVFHSKHIADLAEHIDGALPPGYSVSPEQSLQIREYNPDSGERIRRPQPDITVSTTQSGIPGVIAGGLVPTLTQPIPQTDTLSERDFLTAIIVTSQDDEQPILRIELLSRANKRGGSGDIQYAQKRSETLRSGLQLIEMDYLHESHPMIDGIPFYPSNEGAFPYHITVSNPVPSYEAGIAATYGVAVDQPLPVITVPLLDEDTLTVDFNGIYHRTFGSLSTYGNRVDYDIEPWHMARYSSADQDRFRAVMARVK
jgi:hypothetical protein